MHHGFSLSSSLFFPENLVAGQSRMQWKTWFRMWRFSQTSTSENTCFTRIRLFVKGISHGILVIHQSAPAFAEWCWSAWDARWAQKKQLMGQASEPQKSKKEVGNLKMRPRLLLNQKEQHSTLKRSLANPGQNTNCHQQHLVWCYLPNPQQRQEVQKLT